MTIKAGDTLPADLKLKEMGDAGPKDVTVGELTKGKKVVIFAVPGAFTPTCSMKHLPGFVEKADLTGKAFRVRYVIAVHSGYVDTAGSFQSLVYLRGDT